MCKEGQKVERCLAKEDVPKKILSLLVALAEALVAEPQAALKQFKKLDPERDGCLPLPGQLHFLASLLKEEPSLEDSR